jgi:hypothetical protein
MYKPPLALDEPTANDLVHDSPKSTSRCPAETARVAGTAAKIELYIRIVPANLASHPIR